MIIIITLYNNNYNSGLIIYLPSPPVRKLPCTTLIDPVQQQALSVLQTVHNQPVHKH